MEWTKILIIVLVLAVLICVVNFVVIIILYHRRPLDKLQNSLLLSLGCSDFFAGFFGIPFIFLCTLVNTNPPGCILCIASYLINRFIMLSSLLHLMAVICERYLKIVHPFWFLRADHSLLRARYIVPVLWFASLLISAAPLTWWPLATPCEGDDTLTKNLENFDMACLALYCLMLTVTVYALVRIFLVVRTHLVNINTTAAQVRASMKNQFTMCNTLETDVVDDEKSQQDFFVLRRNASPARSETELSRKSVHSLGKQLLQKEAKIVIRFAVMLLVFIVVWGIYFCLSLIEKEGHEIPLILKEIAYVIRFMNPLIDPWVLSFKNKELRPIYNFSRACGDFSNFCAGFCDSRERKERSGVPQVNHDVLVRVENHDGIDRVTNV